MKIKEIGQIISGYTFRKGIVSQEDGNVFVLQAQNIASGKKITETNNLDRINFTGARGAFFLQSGDILVASRGVERGTFKALFFKADANNVIAPATFLILRVGNKKILPEFLAYFLNSNEGQKRIAQMTLGTNIKAISKRDLLEMDIPASSLERQERIIKLIGNLEVQRSIFVQKIKIQDNIANAIFQNL